MVYTIRTAYVATAAPLVPVNFTATQSTTDFTSAIDLTWITPFPNDDLAGYRIYRDGGLVIDLPVGTNEYTDGGLVSAAWHSYTITSYSPINRESRPSSPPELIRVGFYSGLSVSGRNHEGELGITVIPNAANEIPGFLEHPTHGDFVEKIQPGHDFSYIVKIDGKAYSTGDDTYGQLGTGSTGSRDYFAEVMVGVKKVSIGDRHALLLDHFGNLYGVGQGSEGEFGNGLNQSYNVPTLIKTGVKDMDAGGFVSYYIDEINNLYTCGTGNNSNAPVQWARLSNFTLALTNVKSFHCGTLNGFAILDNDDLWAVSRNSYGQLGRTHNAPAWQFEQISSNVKYVSGEFYHTIIQTINGDVFTAGSNASGELGLGYAGSQREFWNLVMNAPEIEYLDTSANCSAYLNTSKEVFAWGDNSEWQTGRAGSEGELHTPTILVANVRDYKLGTRNAFVLLG